MPGAQCTRSLVCEKNKHTSVVTTVTPELPGIPRAMVYGLLRALPGDQACLTPSPALLIADLTPALGRQNDTTWPYASASFVQHAVRLLTGLVRLPCHHAHAQRCRVHRIPFPTSVTIAKRPSCGHGTAEVLALICPTAKAEYF